MTIDIAREFFLWCTIINAVMFFVSFIMMMLMRKFIYKYHGRWFDLPDAKLSSSMYKMLGFYKILIIVFNLVPYLALVIISN
jgi:Family of unknown function (DUF6868)